MYIELLDTLRCVVDHPQIPLVTAITDRDGRFVVNAVMGCPTCRAEYAIENGVACFRPPETNISLVEPVDDSDDDVAVRVAAFLDVSEGAVIGLIGTWATKSAEVAEVSGSRVFALNSLVALEESDRLGIIRTGRRLPFADGGLRGIAIGEPGWNTHDIEAAARALAPGGRMVLPVSVDLPSVLQEVAHDDALRVAEKRGPLVALRRR